MVDTYDIGTIENDKTPAWKDEGYIETEAENIKIDLNQGNIQTGGDITQSDVNQLDDKEPVLGLIEERVRRLEPPRKEELERDIQELNTEAQQVRSELRLRRDQRRETREDLEALQEELEELRDERDQLLEQAQELRDQGQISQAQSLEGQAGALTANQIPDLAVDISDTERNLEELDQQVQGLNTQHNQLQQEIQEKTQELQDLEPIEIQEEILEDLIIICTTEWETYITGQYKDPKTNRVTRTIEGKGTKILRMGSRAPKHIREDPQINEDDFWDEIYEETREEIFRNPGGFPEGEWIDQLVTKIRQLGAAGQQGIFTGSNWDWRFGPASGAHEFPDDTDFIDKKNQACPDFHDRTM